MSETPLRTRHSERQEVLSDLDAVVRVAGADVGDAEDLAGVPRVGARERERPGISRQTRLSPRAALSVRVRTMEFSVPLFSTPPPAWHACEPPSSGSS